MLACETTPLPPRISRKSGFATSSSDTVSAILDPVNQRFTTEGQKPCNRLKRWYEPMTGKWHSNDPIGISGGLNQYVFCGNNPVNFSDPRGLWWPSGHEALTRKGAQQAGGFTRDDINTMVTANQYVDILRNQLNNPAHFMPGTLGPAGEIIQDCLDKAVEAECAGHHDEAMRLLGEGLHTLQDMGSHYDENAGWLAHAGGFVTFGMFSPDNPERHKAECDRSQNRTIEYLQLFNRRTGRSRL